MGRYNIPERPLEPPDYADNPQCPVCGSETDTIFIDKYGDVVGCEECITRRDAFDWQEENNEY